MECCSTHNYSESSVAHLCESPIHYRSEFCVHRTRQRTDLEMLQAQAVADLMRESLIRFGLVRALDRIDFLYHRAGITNVVRENPYSQRVDRSQVRRLGSLNERICNPERFTFFEATRIQRNVTSAGQATFTTVSSGTTTVLVATPFDAVHGLSSSRSRSRMKQSLYALRNT